MSEPTAAQLKDEGNGLFKKQDYVGALAKSSEARRLRWMVRTLFCMQTALLVIMR